MGNNGALVFIEIWRFAKKTGMYSCLYEYTKICEYNMSRSFFAFDQGLSIS